MIRNMSEEDVRKALIEEGFFTDDPVGQSQLDSFLKDDLYMRYRLMWDGNAKSVDEFAVRLAAIKRANLLEEIQTQRVTYQRGLDKYKIDIGQIIPFLKAGISADELDKIVKVAQEKESVSV